VQRRRNGPESARVTKALDGCETTRDTESAIRAAEFEFVALDHGFHSSSLLTIPCAPYVLGIARS
jgi:hypothetical protein